MSLLRYLRRWCARHGRPVRCRDLFVAPDGRLVGVVWHFGRSYSGEVVRTTGTQLLISQS